MRELTAVDSRSKLIYELIVVDLHGKFVHELTAVDSRKQVDSYTNLSVNWQQLIRAASLIQTENE